LGKGIGSQKLAEERIEHFGSSIFGGVRKITRAA